MSDDDSPSPALARLAGGMLAFIGGAWTLGGAVSAVAALFIGEACGFSLALFALAVGMLLLAKSVQVVTGEARTTRAVSLLAVAFAFVIGSASLALIQLSWAAAGVVSTFALPFGIVAVLSLAGGRDYADWRAQRNADD